MDFNEGQAMVVTGLFILFIVWDICWDIAKERIKGVNGIPGKALVLSALTVQLVGFFDRKNVDILGKSKEQQEKLLIDQQLAIDGARLCFCVFLGYVQPGMASAKSGGRWTNIAALALSLCLHIATEVLALESVNEAGKLRNGEFVSSNVVFLVGATCLVIYLGCTVLAGKFIQDSLSQKIPQILSENLLKDDRSSSFRLEMLKSWTVAFAWKAQYKIASSAFVPPVGMIVTVCIAVVGNKARRLLHHGSNVGLTSYLQCIFVNIGWIAILWRWFMAVCYYRYSTNRKLLDVFQFTNRFRELLFLYIRIELNPRQLITESYLKRKTSSVLWATVALLTWAILFIMLIPLIILIVVINFLFYFSFLSWCFSGILSGLSNATGLTNMLMKMVDCQGSTATKEDKDSEELAAKGEDEVFLKCKESLQKMFQCRQQDEVDRLWKYHLKSFNQIKPRMKEAYEGIQKCQELFKKLNKKRGREVVQEFQSYRAWKMVAVAMIDIMVGILAKFGWWDLKMDMDVEDMIKVYKEIKDLLEFVDCPENTAMDPMDMFGTCNFEAFEMSLEADKHIRRIEKQIKQQQHTGGDAQQIPKPEDFFKFLEEEGRKETSEIDYGDGFTQMEIIALSSGLFCSLICIPGGVTGLVNDLLKPVDRSLDSLDGSVGGCLWFVVKTLGLLLLYFMIAILLLPLTPIFLLIMTLSERDDMYKFGYYKDSGLMKSRHFVYIAILDSYISDLKKINSNNGKEVISHLGNEIIGCFGELIRCCVQELPVLLIKHSNKWAEEFQEDKISKALEIAEKLRALMEMSRTEDIYTEINVNGVHEKTENEIQIDMMDSK